MKVALLCEADADQDGLFLLIGGLLGVPVDPHLPRLQTRRGWSNVLSLVPSVYKSLHYRQPDVEGLVIAADTDDSPLHTRAHEVPGAEDPACRLCELRRAVESVGRSVRPRAQAPSLHIALGFAVPCIEAWWLFGRNRHVSEACWTQRSQPGACPYTRDSLKEELYGVRRPTTEAARQTSLREARRLVDEDKLQALEKCFPMGFGALADGFRAWGRRP